MAKLEWGLNPEIIRTTSVAIVERTILYAASACPPAAEKITVQRLLNSVQRGFAQKIAKIYHTESIYAALVLAGLLPLDLQIWEVARLYEYKRGRPIPELESKQLEKSMTFWEAAHPAMEPDISFEKEEKIGPGRPNLIMNCC